jgi:tetratricopeptide (TPR) repeat protein
MSSTKKIKSTVVLILMTFVFVNCSVKWADKLADKSFDKYCISQHRKSMRILNRAILFNKKSTLAYWRRADLYSKKDNYGKSIQDLNKAIIIDSSFEKGHLFGDRAEAKLMLEDYDGAFKDFSKAISMCTVELNLPSTPLERYFYSRSCVLLAKKDTASALKDLDSAIFYWGSYCNALYLRAKLLTIKGQYQDAIKDYKKMPFSQMDEEFDYNAENFFYRGLSKYKTGDTSYCADWKISEKYGLKIANDYIKKYCTK